MRVGELFDIFKKFFRLFLVLLGGYIMLLEIGMAISESHVLKYISSWFILFEMCGIGIALLIIGGVKLLTKEKDPEVRKLINIRNRKYKIFFILLGTYIIILEIVMAIVESPLNIDIGTSFFFLIRFVFGIFSIVQGILISR